jgi:hypothetical protein
MATETKEAPKAEKAAAIALAKTPREALEQERILRPVVTVAAHLPTDFDTPFPVAVPHTPTDEEKLAAAAKAEVLKKIGEILKTYHNNESEIPASNEYWNLLAKYRGM